MSRAHVFQWRKWFFERQEEGEFYSRPGLPTISKSAENVEKVRTVLHNNRRSTIRMNAEELNIKKQSVRLLLLKIL
jgi:hypothetical protein